MGENKPARFKMSLQRANVGLSPTRVKMSCESAYVGLSPTRFQQSYRKAHTPGCPLPCRKRADYVIRNNANAVFIFLGDEPRTIEDHPGTAANSPLGWPWAPLQKTEPPSWVSEINALQ